MADNQRKSRRARGVALVEFALVAVLLFTLIFGIIGYAYMMSFQQSLTQAAAEGARAGAVAPSGSAASAATAAINDAIGGFDVTCASTGMTCVPPVVGPCVNDTSKQCVTVTLRYAYRDNPLLPSIPGLGVVMPQIIDYTAVAEVNS